MPINWILGHKPQQLSISFFCFLLLRLVLEAELQSIKALEPSVNQNLQIFLFFYFHFTFYF